MPDKITHVREREGLSAVAAKTKIQKVEHDRTEHCRYFTHREWGDSRSYDVSVNTSRYGIKKTGDMLAHLAAAARDAAADEAPAAEKEAAQ